MNSPQKWTRHSLSIQPRSKTPASWHKIPPRARCKALSHRHHRHTMPLQRLTPRDPERWANSNPNTDFPDYSLQVSFPDSDDEQDGKAATTGTKLFPVSQKTESFLSSCFTTALPNQVRRQWKAECGAPHTGVAACPNMDKILKSRLSAQTKAKDKQLAENPSSVVRCHGTTILHLRGGQQRTAAP